MKNIILQANNLFCGYGEKSVLCHINLEIFKGERISIVGPNAAGKTTLLKVFSKAIKPQKGEIRIESKNLADISRKQLAKKIAVVGQSIDQAPLTVKQYVLLGRLPFFRRYQFFETKNDMDIVHEYMELTDTLKFENALISEISGGERQLAGIARALVQQPVLLLLDEPTSHLDIAHQAQIMKLIVRFTEELNLTVIMVLHDLNLAAEYSDRLILLDGEKRCIYQKGTPDEVLTENSIQDVYKAGVHVEKNPISGKPYVFLIRER